VPGPESNGRRAPGISTTDEERDEALKRAGEVRSWLTDKGWPPPIYADCGNGAHLLYRVDLPVDDRNLLKPVLNELVGRFDDDPRGAARRMHLPEVPTMVPNFREKVPVLVPTDSPLIGTICRDLQRKRQICADRLIVARFGRVGSCETQRQ